jgi:hypothetical protein
MEPAPKLIFKRPENPYIVTAGSNASDAFFFHELCRTSGSDVAYQWLHAQLSAKGKGSGTGSATCTPNRSPHNSAPTTPRGRNVGILLPLKTSQIKEEETSVTTEESSRVSTSGLEAQNTERSADSTRSMDRPSDVKAFCAEHSNDSNIGLLYTDAAHTILDSQQ